ncbi:MAG: glycoside hydrolase family 13 protein [Oscillospiraceae bacterium]|nr:glycoside hydrolase family 13 protein [Oscillospiraceae bacterium]MBQ4302406.1 glycoside hydrolase family 13 protein [Oscillospiraceae bacterium]MBQ6031335.1 glycoside hydrolase family 13 protein [Oscillospiraceae bacterium]
MRILYNSRDSEYKRPFGTLTEDQTCTIRIRIPAELECRGVQLVLEHEDGRPFREFRLVWAGQDADYHIFKCDFSIQARGLYFYWFRVTGKTGPFRLFRCGDDTNMEDGDRWQLSVVPADFTVPAAFRGRVMYQIFPDRFCRVGDCDASEKLKPWTLREDWGGTPEYRPDPKTGEVLCNDFFGGNFRGIASKLDYLKDLGVELLYLNPISMAFSNHRYDTADYKRPDPLLGTEEDFRALCDAAHARGMRVILDGVYSHTGSNSVYFDKNGVFGTGACSAGTASPYYSWYRFRRFPDDYECWWNFPTLPNVTETEESYQDFIIRDEDSVIAHWLRLGADGFRLDVADELPDSFILNFKRGLRARKPDGFLMGEVWEDASNKTAYSVRRRYFVDGELDSVMNYPWRTAILRYLRAEDDGAALGETVMTIAENYPPQVLQAVMNALSTHDTPRALTLLHGDCPETREAQASFRLTPDEREAAFEKLRAAAFLQYTLPGNPCLYYGDEAGMEGCKDPFNRACYPWGQADERFLNLFRSLGRLKRETPALRAGDVRVMRAGGGVFAFRRSLRSADDLPTETVVCYVNRSGGPIFVPARHALLAQNASRTDGGFELSPGGFGCFAE